MSAEYEKRLEAEIDRELKSLPELLAPHSLAARVLAAIDARLGLPWYRQVWQAWPMPLQVAALVVLLAAFGGLCFATWKLSHAATFAEAMRQVWSQLGSITALWHAINALFNAGVLALKQLGTGFIIGCFAAFALAYGLCVGLGTVYVRIGLARR